MFIIVLFTCVLVSLLRGFSQFYHIQDMVFIWNTHKSGYTYPHKYNKPWNPHHALAILIVTIAGFALKQLCFQFGLNSNVKHVFYFDLCGVFTAVYTVYNTVHYVLIHHCHNRLKHKALIGVFNPWALVPI